MGTIPVNSQIDVTEIPHLEHCYESHRKECICGYEWYSRPDKAIALNENGDWILQVNQVNEHSFTFKGAFRYPIFKRHPLGGVSIVSEGVIFSEEHKEYINAFEAAEAAAEWYNAKWQNNQEPIFQK